MEKTKRISLKKALERKDLLVLDGSLASELEKRGASLDHQLWSARTLSDQPELIRAIHLDYLRAGADIICSNTYQATYQGFARIGCSEEETTRLLRLSIELCQQARTAFLRERPAAGSVPLIAAALGPYGAYLADGSEYRGVYDLDAIGLMDFHQQRLAIMVESSADFILFETVPSLAEVMALCSLMNTYPDREYIISLSCRDPQTLADGTPLEAVLEFLNQEEGIAAVGFNCCPPEWIIDLIELAISNSRFPVLVYPNRGDTWDAVEKKWIRRTQEINWREMAARWKAAGARIIGGCCLTGPETIAEIRSNGGQQAG